MSSMTRSVLFFAVAAYYGCNVEKADAVRLNLRMEGEVIPNSMGPGPNMNEKAKARLLARKLDKAALRERAAHSQETRKFVPGAEFLPGSLSEPTEMPTTTSEAAPAPPVTTAETGTVTNQVRQWELQGAVFENDKTDKDQHGRGIVRVLPVIEKKDNVPRRPESVAAASTRSGAKLPADKTQSHPPATTDSPAIELQDHKPLRDSKNGSSGPKRWLGRFFDLKLPQKVALIFFGIALLAIGVAVIVMRDEMGSGPSPDLETGNWTAY